MNFWVLLKVWAARVLDLVVLELPLSFRSNSIFLDFFFIFFSFCWFFGHVWLVGWLASWWWSMCWVRNKKSISDYNKKENAWKSRQHKLVVQLPRVIYLYITMVIQYNNNNYYCIGWLLGHRTVSSLSDIILSEPTYIDFFCILAGWYSFNLMIGVC